MIHYAKLGHIAKRAHQAVEFEGQLLAEHVFTREGFHDLFSILYQRRAPTHESQVVSVKPKVGFCPGIPECAGLPMRKHFRTGAMPFQPKLSFLESRIILMENKDCTVGVCHLAKEMEQFFVNGDSDEVFFVAEGGGQLQTVFGNIDYTAHDYLVVPRGVPYRFRFDSQVAPRQRFLCVEAFRGFGLPKEFLNHRGQLRLDAPYSERDFRLPQELLDTKGLNPEIMVCRNRTLSLRTYTEWPYEVVGWDGYVYPFAFNVHDYKPKTSTFHLPPTSHCVFEARGFVMMNFVPRIVDYGENAIPCPYPHSSIDCDEVLYYVDGDFTSRKGIDQYSVSFHPAGIPHGPHPEKYERSLGVARTNELAIMVDTFAPLTVSASSKPLDDVDYHFSWNTKEHL